MTQKILTVLFFFIVCGLLIAQRFDVPKTEKVRAVREQTDGAHWINKTYKRGALIQTKKNERVEIHIGDSTVIALDENTTIELKRIDEDERKIRFTRGRLLVESQRPITIETNFTKNTLASGQASFVNYDFKETISVIALDRVVTTTFDDRVVEIIAPDAIDVHETKPTSITHFKFNILQNTARVFYEWANKKADAEESSFKNRQ